MDYSGRKLSQETRNKLYRPVNGTVEVRLLIASTEIYHMLLALGLN